MRVVLLNRLVNGSESPMNLTSDPKETRNAMSVFEACNHVYRTAAYCDIGRFTQNVERP